MAGAYLVAAQLTLEGFIATITSRNSPQVDVLVYYPKTGKSYGIQVKTSSSETQWTLKGHRKNDALFYVFVTLRGDGKHIFFVIPSKDIGEYVSKKGNRWSFFCGDETTINRWDLLKS